MRTPITYYGGKQLLSKKICALIPKHKIYCEPFIGGAAVFFSKQPSQIEVINDTNKELINFYQVIKNNFKALEKKIAASLHSRDLHRKANVIYKNPDMFGDIDRAWAVWNIANQSFLSIFGKSYATDAKGRATKTIMSKRKTFTNELEERLQNVELECTDALKIIKINDGKDTFFYLDPPYFNSDMGHYDGYSKDDFKNLLELISGIKGKFLLSSYRSDILTEYQKRNKWNFMELKMRSPATKTNKSKIEVITANYIIQDANNKV